MPPASTGFDGRGSAGDIKLFYKRSAKMYEEAFYFHRANRADVFCGLQVAAGASRALQNSYLILDFKPDFCDIHS